LILKTHGLEGTRMNLSALVLILSIAAVLKLTLGLTVTLFWKRRRGRRGSKAPAGEQPTESARRPLTVLRRDAGHQSVTMLDGGRGHSVELVYHVDPGRQEMRREARLARAGATP